MAQNGAFSSLHTSVPPDLIAKVTLYLSWLKYSISKSRTIVLELPYQRHLGVYHRQPCEVPHGVSVVGRLILHSWEEVGFDGPPFLGYHLPLEFPGGVLACNSGSEVC